MQEPDRQDRQGGARPRETSPSSKHNLSSYNGAQLKEECCNGNDPILDDAFRFNVSDLSMDGHETHAKGKLGEFLERLDADRGFRTSLVYRTLNGESLIRDRFSRRCSVVHSVFDYFRPFAMEPIASCNFFSGRNTALEAAIPPKIDAPAGRSDGCSSTMTRLRTSRIQVGWLLARTEQIS